MRSTLIVPFWNQYAEWPYVLRGIKDQVRQPDQYILVIDDSRQVIPPCEDIPFYVVRTPGRFDNEYSRGAALNTALSMRNGDVIITIDADCVMCPTLVQTYMDIYGGRRKSWKYRLQKNGAQKEIRANPDKEIYIGPRYYIPKPQELPSSATFPVLDRLTSKDRRSCRGRPDGTAAVWGCNMAFPKSALSVESRFRNIGKHQDAKWYHRIKKKGKFEARPAPDDCYVLHMGPNYEGRYF